MPISFDLEQLRVKFNISNYFETGLFDVSNETSIIKALKCNFKKLYSVEIYYPFVDKANNILKNDIDNGRLTIINDDSTHLNKYLTDELFSEKTLFFLDAHIDNLRVKEYTDKCPLFNELDAIGNLSVKNNIICIDDLRILNEKFPWGEEKYGEINWIDEIKKKILCINSHYEFDTLDGIIPNDILLAYV
jgi:hypothetical protein